MRRLVCCLFAFLATPLCAQTPKDFELARLETLSATELAQQLLSPDQASRVVAKKIYELAPGSRQVTFYTRATFLTAHVCVRDSFTVDLVPANSESARQGKVGISYTWMRPEVALGSVCADPAPPVFAHLNAGEASGAAKTLEWLDARRQAAKRGEKETLDLYCESKLPVDPCTTGAQTVLANLKLEQTYLFFDAYTLLMPGDKAVWRVETSANPSGKPFISMTYFIPAPF